MASNHRGHKSRTRILLFLLSLSLPLCVTPWLNTHALAGAHAWSTWLPATAAVSGSPLQPETPSASPSVASTEAATGSGTAQAAAALAAVAPPSGQSAAARLVLTMTATFTNVGTTDVRNGYVDVPLLASTPGSAQRILNEKITPQPLEIREDCLGNRVGRFSLDHIPAGGKLAIRHEYVLAFGVATASHPAAAPLPEHLRPEPKVEADAPQIKNLACEISEGITDPRELAIEIEQHTRSLITYDAQSPTRNRGALAALESGSGVCEEYACLFTAIARAAGLPARVVHGFARDLDSTRSAWTGIAGTGTALAAYRHAWAEVYLAGQGWVAVDPAYRRSNLDAPELRQLAPGTYIVEGYANNAVIGRYVGGRLQGERKETLSW